MSEGAWCYGCETEMGSDGQCACPHRKSSRELAEVLTTLAQAVGVADWPPSVTAADRERIAAAALKAYQWARRLGL